MVLWVFSGLLFLDCSVKVCGSGDMKSRSNESGWWVGCVEGVVNQGVEDEMCRFEQVSRAHQSEERGAAYTRRLATFVVAGQSLL